MTNTHDATMRERAEKKTKHKQQEPEIPSNTHCARHEIVSQNNTNTCLTYDKDDAMELLFRLENDL